MAYTSVSVSSIHSAYDRKSGAIAYRTTISAVIAPMCAMGPSDPAGSPDATAQHRPTTLTIQTFGVSVEGRLQPFR